MVQRYGITYSLKLVLHTVATDGVTIPKGTIISSYDMDNNFPSLYTTALLVTHDDVAGCVIQRYNDTTILQLVSHDITINAGEYAYVGVTFVCL